MKRIILVALVLLSITGCAQESTNYESITYYASSRGLFIDVAISPNKMAVRLERLDTVRKEEEISMEQWQSLIDMIDNVPEVVLKEHAFNAKKAEVDSAIKGTLVLSSSNSEQERTIIIDHSNPPTELSTLINQIQTLIESVE